MTPVRLAVLLTVGVLALFSIPGTSIPDVDLLTADKIVHAALFAVLGWAWLRAFPDRAAWVVAGGLAFAIGTEVWQSALPLGRTGDPADALADALGLAVAVVVWTLRRARAERA